MSANEDKLSYEDIIKYIKEFSKLESKSSLTQIQKLLFNAIEGYDPKIKNEVDIKSNH